MNDDLRVRAIRRIADQEGTPFYVYDQGAIQANYRRLRDAFSRKVRIFYSMKANPNPWLVKMLMKEGAGVEVASGGELSTALGCGIEAGKIVYAGPGKTDAELRLALCAGVLTINVESIGEVQRIQKLCETIGATCNVAIRVNPLKGIAAFRAKMGGRPSQFGIDEEQVPKILDWIDRLAHVRCIGIHVYAGTQILDGFALGDYVFDVIQMARGFFRGRRRPCAIDFGGGFGVPYQPGQAPLDLSAVSSGLARAEAEFAECRDGSMTFFAESGRYVVANGGAYVARIVDIKVSRGRRFLVLDGGINHCASSAGIGAVIRRPRRIRLVGAEPSSETMTVDIVGPLCTPSDLLGHRVVVPASAARGDLVILDDVGAYGRSAGLLGFLSHDWPAEYRLWGTGEYGCVARSISAAEIVKLQSAGMAFDD